MENNDFEKKIKNVFADFSPEVDADAVWENVEPHLEKKKRRRYIFWVFLFGMAGLSWLFLQNNFSSHNSKTAVNETEDVVLPKVNISSNKPEISDEINIDVKAEIESHKPVSQDFAKVNKIPETELFISKSAKELTSIIQEGNDKKIPDTNEQENDFETESPNLLSLNQESKLENDFEEENEVFSDILEKNIQEKEVIAEKNRPNFELEETEIISEKPEIIIPEDKDEKSLKQKKIKKKTSKKKKFKKKKSKKKKKKSKKRKRKKIKRNKTKKWRPYIQAYFAPGYSFKQLRIRNSGEGIDVLKTRKETESPLETFGGGLDLQFIRKGGLLLTGGIQYRQINELYSKKFFEEKVSFRQGVVAVVENSLGEVIESETGLKEIKTTTEGVIKNYNSYRFLNVPIGVGYHSSNRNFGQKFSGGLNFNFYFNMEGTITDSRNNPIEISGSSSDFIYSSIFKRKANANVWLRYEFYKKINSRASWIIAPAIEAATGSLTKSNYLFSHKYTNFEIRAGFNYLLRKEKKKKRKRRSKK